MSASAGGPLRHLDAALAELRRDGLFRADEAERASTAIVLCSNDYLGYASLPLEVDKAAGGAGASRLVCGDSREHRLAEKSIADWLEAEAALLFSSGYAANVGVVSALAGPGDLVVSDRLNHASIIDGCRLSGAQVAIVEHCDIGAVETALIGAAAARRRWVVSESYFSMDGDVPDLPALRSLCDRHDAALIVDEAHAVGVFGPSGRGLCAESGVRPDVLVGTLGKALGLQGAFAVGSHALRSWLWNRARSFVFSTGVSPAIASAVPARVARAAGDDEGRRRLHHSARVLRDVVGATTIGRLSAGRGPILPWLLGSADAAVAAAAKLNRGGLLVRAIRPPTVPTGAARLRLTSSAALGARELEMVAAAFRCFT